MTNESGPHDTKRWEHPLDRAVVELAARQHNVISLAQLAAMGMTATMVHKRVRKGWLRRVHRGVYAVGHTKLTDHGRYKAAELALGEGAAVSHRSGGHLWEIRPPWRNAVELTTEQYRSPRQTIRIHTAPLTGRDVTTRHGIRVTTPARTIIDLADVLTARAVEKALGLAERAELLTAGDITPIHGRRGTGVLNAILARPHAHGRFTRSELEDRFVDLVRTYGLPHPETNTIVEGYEVDAYWADHGLIVEVDHYATHGDPAAFERDRLKDADLVARGYVVIRVTDTQLRDRPEHVAATIHRALGARSRASPALVRE